MTFVVTENCIKCKYQDCVEVCPVDCFYEGPNFLVINPDECIDCALCEPECPANAIFSEDELPAGQEVFIELNAELSQTWPNITQIGDVIIIVVVAYKSGHYVFAFEQGTVKTRIHRRSAKRIFLTGTYYIFQCFRLVVFRQRNMEKR